MVPVLVTACASKPVEYLAFADVAVKAAQKAKAESLSGDLYRQAENYLLRAKKDYAEGYYESCRKNADQARRLAEQAEYQALGKQNRVAPVTEAPLEAAPPPPPEGVP